MSDQDGRIALITRVAGRLTVLLLCSVLFACGSEEPGAAPNPGQPAPSIQLPVLGPNVLFSTIDTLGADALGAYENPLAPSPAIDALAADGVRFEQ